MGWSGAGELPRATSARPPLLLALLGLAGLVAAACLAVAEVATSTAACGSILDPVQGSAAVGCEHALNQQRARAVPAGAIGAGLVVVPWLLAGARRSGAAGRSRAQRAAWASAAVVGTALAAWAWSAYTATV